MRRGATFLAAALALLACTSEGRAPARPAPAPSPPAVPPAPAAPAAVDVTAASYQPPPMPHARLSLGGRTLDVEVATSRAQRTRGMMWRTVMPEGTGMLFVFPAEEPLTFWMRNTLIPLDMVFLDARLAVVGIVERAEPKTLTSRGPGALAQYVLEVPGGWAAAHRVQPGMRATVEGLERFVGED